MSRPGLRLGRVVVVSAVLSATVGIVFAPQGARASHCWKPDGTNVNVGGVGTVGVEQPNAGTLEHDVHVCADPPHQQATVDVQGDTKVAAGTCGPLGCTSLGSTGAEVTSTRLRVDGPHSRAKPIPRSPHREARHRRSHRCTTPSTRSSTTCTTSRCTAYRTTTRGAHTCSSQASPWWRWSGCAR
jgi:hypothetical protein